MCIFMSRYICFEWNKNKSLSVLHSIVLTCYMKIYAYNTYAWGTMIRFVEITNKANEFSFDLGFNDFYNFYYIPTTITILLY